MTIRTPQQNRALHKGCAMLAESLNDAGFDMRRTLKHDVDIPWTQESVKTHLFKPILEAMTGKDSTTEMTTKEVSEIWDVMSRHLGQKVGVSVEFPHEDRGERNE